MPPKPKTAQSRETLARHASALERSAGLLRATIQMMADEGFDSLEVTNYDQMTRALLYVNNFASAASNALIEAQTDRGDFKAATVATKKRAKKEG